jgi:hypothetical protein
MDEPMMSDFDRAQMEFRRQRAVELKSECAQSMRQLDFEGVTAENFTIEQYEQWVQRLGAAIRQFGNTDLADGFQAAHARAWQAMKHLRQFMTLSFARDLTNLERAEADAAAVVDDDANEHLERVEAEVSAYLKGLGTGGV